VIATGGGPQHSRAMYHGLRPLVASLGGLSAAQAIYVTDAEFPDKGALQPQLTKVTADLAEELYRFAQSIVHAFVAA